MRGSRPSCRDCSRFHVDNGRSVDRLELADSHAQNIDIQDPHLIGQEVSGEPEIEIPEAVRDVYKLWRPTPLYPYANAEAGVRKLSTETGAGQWGSALARAGRR